MTQWKCVGPLLLSAIILASCAKKSATSVSGESSKPGPVTNGKPPATGGQTVPSKPSVTLPQQASVEGGWLSKCVPDATASSNEKRSSSNNKMTITSGRLIGVFNVFSDSNCQSIKLAATAEYNLTLGAVNAVGIRTADLTVVKAQEIMAAQEAVQAANESKFCGKSDWVINQPVEISTCDDIKIFRKGSSIFTLMKVDGNQLWMGDSSADGAGETAATRPTKLDLAEPYSRQP